MSPQVLPEGEAGSTGLTGEPFPSVDSLVCPQRPPPREGFPTHRTSVRALSSVDAPVALQADGVPEALPALRALVWFLHQVNGPVSLQVVFGFEGLPAGGAAERSRVGVHQLVGLQARFGFESLLAEPAGERRVFLFFMSQQVELQGSGGAEPSGAPVAAERPPLFVDVHVLRQVELTGKTLLANLTDKHFPRASDHRVTWDLELRGVCGAKILSRVWAGGGKIKRLNKRTHFLHQTF